MLESLVASILNRVLGNYVSNLNYDQLKIGIWNGEVNLKNLKLRREALDKLDLPIDVLEGYLEELTLSIPWSNLKTKPVKVFVNNVYLLAVPKNDDTFNAKDEEDRAQQLKQRRLATAELIENAQTSPENQSKTNDSESEGFVNQLVTKIIDNLQVSLKNIHIRYEDKASDPGHPFAIGVTLKELSAVSTDGEWKPMFISEATNTTHKLAKLESLSVYWNTDSRSLAGLSHGEASKAYTDLIPAGDHAPKEHQYILRPVSGTGKVILNKKFGSGVAKVDASLLFDQLGFALDEDQYRDAILMIDLFHANLKKQKYRSLCPEEGLAKKTSPKAYFQFAANAVLSEIHDRNYKWTWDHFKERRDQRLAYIKCYVAQKMKKATPEQQKQLKQLEWDLSFEDIRFYRSIAKSRLRREKIRIEEENKKNASKGGWLSAWWGGGNEEGNSSNKDDDSMVMTEEQKRELYDAIEYDEEKAQIAAAIDMPHDTIKFALSTRLNRGSFSLRRRPNDTSTEELASLVFDAVSVEAIQYIASMKVTAGLGDLRLYDGSTANTLYPQLIGVKKTGKDGSLSLLDAQMPALRRDSPHDEAIQDPFFKVVFEKKPLNKAADNAISLTMRHLEIIYNPTVIMGILHFFKPPQTEMESLDALMEVAGDTLYGFKEQTRAGLEYALETHTTIELDINMDAPVIIIPESCTDKNAPVMIIDAGHINIDSDLANQGVVSSLKPKGEKYNEEDFKALEGLMYDKFNLQLTQTKVLIGNNVRECISQLGQKAPEGTVDAHVIERIDMQFLIELCILPDSSQFTNMKISGHLPLLSVNFSDSKYKTLMKMIDLMVPPSPPADDADHVSSATPPKTPRENMIAQRFWGGTTQHDLLVSDAESIEHPHPSSSSKAASVASVTSAEGLQVEKLKFSFKVDKVSVSLHETSMQETRTVDVLLSEFVLERFALVFANRPYDMAVDVSLKALRVIDKMEHGHEYPYLVTSNHVDGVRHQSQQHGKDLVRVQYMRVSKEHPLYETEFGGFDQTVDVTLSTLNIVVTRSSILTLYNWIMKTFTAPPSQQPEVHDDHSSARSQRPQLTSSKSSDPPKKSTPQNDTNSGTIKVNVCMDSLALLLNLDGKLLGLIELSFGDLAILLLPKTLKVIGKFGNFTLIDGSALDTRATETQTVSAVGDKDILSIQGDELMRFTYETFDPKADSFPGYDQMFHLRMGALRVLFTDSVKPILDFLSEFLQMKAVYDAARVTAAEAAQQMQDTNARFHFDVAIKSPVVLFPPKEGTETVIAHLGEIRAINRFLSVTRRDPANAKAAPVDVPVALIQCGLHSISLRTSSERMGGGEGQRIREQSVIDDLDITCNIESAEQPEKVLGPAMRIMGNVSDVRLAINEHQYKALLQIYTMLMTTFLSPTEEPSADQTEDAQSHHLSDVASSPNRHEKAPTDLRDMASSANQDGDRLQMDMTLKIDMICMEILTCPSLESKDQHESFSKLLFNQTSMKLQTTRDGSMLMEVQLKSMSFADTRSDSNSKFKEILPESHLDGPQFQLKLTNGLQDGQQTMDISVTVDSPKVVLSLDYVLLLKDFFMSPFVEEPPQTEAQKYVTSQRAKDHLQVLENRRPGSGVGPKTPSMHTTADSRRQRLQPPPKEEPTVSRLWYRVNVVDVKVICLAQPEKESSEALIFSFDQLLVKQRQDLEVDVHGVCMTLCRMDIQSDSTMRFVEAFDVNLSLEASSASRGHNVTVVKLHVQPIILRLSYHDAMIITDIISKVMQVMGNASSSTNQGQNGSRTPPCLAEPPEDDRLLTVSTSNLGLDESATDDTRTTAAHQHIEPYIVMSKESLTATFEGLQLVMIEDLHDLPFVDVMVQPFTANASDWSRALSASVQFSLLANYFNFKNSHWEPIVEPWSFGIKASKDTDSDGLNLELESKERLNINVTHTFVNTMLSLSATLSEIQPLAENAQNLQVAPYLIRNRTGYDLRFWNMSDDAEDGDTEIYKLKHGEQRRWTFRDWKKRRERINLGKNLLGVQLEKFGWESLPHVPLDQEGKQSYRLRPEVDGIPHRLVVDIKLENHVKTVTFRSGLVIENKLQQAMQMTLVSDKRWIMSDIWTLQPGEDEVIPIGLCYSWWITVRPSDQYHWSKQTMHWSDIIHPESPKCIVCEANTPEDPPFIYHVNGKFDNPLYQQYPFMAVQFGPPIQVENNLPLDFNLTMIDTQTQRRYTAHVKKGDTAYIHSIMSGNSVCIGVDLASDEYLPSELTTIQAEDRYSNKGYPLPITSNQGVVTYLRLNVLRLKKVNDALSINVYSPYLVINKTDLPISLKPRKSSSHAKSTPERIEPPSPNTTTIFPYMFTYPEVDPHNRVLLCVEDSKWSQPLSFEAVGSTQDVTFPTSNGSFEMHAGLRVEEGVGMYRFTKMVTIAPRFIVKNNTSVEINLCEFGQSTITRLGAGQKAPIYQTGKSEVKWFCLQRQDNDPSWWSSPFDVQEVGQVFVKARTDDPTDPMLVRATVLLKNATLFVTLEQVDEWPCMIINYTSVEIEFYQDDTGLEDLKEKQKKVLPKPRRFKLLSKESMKYSWDMPVAKEKRLMLDVCGRKRNINFQAIGAQVPFRYKKHKDSGPGGGTMSIDIVADQSALVLVLTDFNPEMSLFRPKSSASSTLGSSSREGSVRDYFETVSVEHVVNFTCTLNLAGIGLSIINKNVQEMAYATVQGLELKYSDSNLYQSIRASIQWFQVDNQFHSSTYPILFFPSTLPKEPSDEATHPTFHAALDRVKDDAHGVHYFKLFSVLLQEMTLEVDEDFLYALMEFCEFSYPNAPTATSSESALFSTEVQEPEVEFSNALYYFEEFCIQPMRLNMSFVRTERISTADPSESSGGSPISYAFNVFTMTLGNINDAPIKLNALMVENLRASYDDLMSRMVMHYREQVIYQVHKILGSADIFGNPVGLFTNLSSGFGELFYEPYQGFIMSDRPQDLGIGIARGVGGFLKKSVFGITDSVSRFTGSLGKGLSAATLDKKFQERRRLTMTRNKPRHAMYGVTQGVTYLGTSVASGVAGLVKRPWEGAETGGVTGFFGGVGKGLVGVLTKPVVGIFDLASNVTAGIRETTTVFDAADIGRERLPRYIGKDGIVRAYSQREALGQMWLMDMERGRFSQEMYVAHCTVESDETIAMLTCTRVLVLQSRKLTLDWQQSLDDLQSCEPSIDGILLHLKIPRTRCIPVLEDTSRTWFALQIQTALEERREDRSRQ